MYETLTNYIPSLEKSDFGKWVQQPDFPFVLYEWEVRRLIDEIHDFADDHKGRNGFDYCRILAENGIAWSMKSMKEADAAALGGRAVIALLMGAARAEQFCDGALLEFCEAGCVLRWLRRLKEIDELAAVAGRESA